MEDWEKEKSKYQQREMFLVGFFVGWYTLCFFLTKGLTFKSEYYMDIVFFPFFALIATSLIYCMTLLREKKHGILISFAIASTIWGIYVLRHYQVVEHKKSVTIEQIDAITDSLNRMYQPKQYVKSE